MNGLFFQVIANALLRLPKKFEPKLLDPIFSYWEDVPSMMEEFLRQLSLIGSQPELEDRFIELWLCVGEKVLSSKDCKTLGYYLEDDIKNILGLLIFTDPTGILKWNVQEWPQLASIQITGRG